LVVDDNPTNRRAAIAHLRSFGMSAAEATSAAEAITLLERGDVFDVALLDHTLADMSGPELAVKVQSRRPELPLVLMTSLGHPKGDSAIFQTFTAVLTKPIKRSRLHAALLDLWVRDGRLRAHADRSEFDRGMADRTP